MKLTERDIARTIGAYLQLDGWRLLFCEPMSRRDLGKGFGEPGMADLLAIRYTTAPRFKGTGGPSFHGPWADGHEIIWVEFKRPKGRIAPLQRIWHDAERARGALTIILGEDSPASIEGFIQHYKTIGLSRGRV